MAENRAALFGGEPVVNIYKVDEDIMYKPELESHGIMQDEI